MEQPTTTTELKESKVEINEKNPFVLVCVYGTLRKGEGNHRILENNSELLGTYKSEPTFTMYGRRRGFPIVVPKGDTSIEYEVYKVTDPTTVKRLHSLEGCTGIPGHADNWYDIMPMETPHGKGYIYVHHTHKEDENSVIKTGNWKHKSI